MPLMRTELLVSGWVQKVGYRSFVYRQAYDLDITGTVENLRDGTVRIVAEGEAEKIQEFQKALWVKEFPIRVEGVQTAREGKIEKRSHGVFSIVRTEEEKSFEGVLDKLDLGTRYLIVMGEGVRSAGVEVGSRIEAFQKATVASFLDLDEKYGKVSTYLEEIAKTNQETSKHLERLSKLVERIAEERAHR
ncbi:MAG: acylphosphatase [Euryarchaeota archaeon]|nr:acylphosphatase [Euryarchaeota archaeon]